jgi:general secretion pathway protein G
MRKPPQRNERREEGFTLVELMVVISIIAILATIVTVSVLGVRDDANVSAAQAQIVNLKTALTSYNLAFGRFPTAAEGLDALIHNEKRSFLDAQQVPLDPWDKPYIYTSEGPRQFKIISYGADGQPGGSSYDADISSDNLKGGK